MRIWVDLSNSPHALLFEPVIGTLHARGHEVVLTARDNAQTVELARERWPDVEVIGGESPRGRASKARTLARRIAHLSRWARAREPDVALSHNSYAQIVAAKLNRVPIVTAMDYEHQPANHLAFRLATVVLLPEAMRSVDVQSLGATPQKTRFYPGLKEEIYLGGFEPDAHVRDELGVPDDGRTKLIVTRTPPDRALYHDADNPLFIEALKAIAEDPEARVVALARTTEQRRFLTALGVERLVVPASAVDTRSLMYGADLVLGGGGTMTREAALLGAPTYTVFAGKVPAVDSWLESSGRLMRLGSAPELGRVLRRSGPLRDLRELRARSELLIEHFVAGATMSRPPSGGAAEEWIPRPARLPA